MDKKKIIVIISLIVIILASVITNIYILSNQEEDEEFKIDGITETENKEILKDAKVGGLDITNISLLNKDGTSIYRAKITNNTDKDIDIDKLYVVFYEDKNEISLLGLSNAKIKSNDSTYISISSIDDLTKSTDIKYVVE